VNSDAGLGNSVATWKIREWSNIQESAPSTGDVVQGQGEGTFVLGKEAVQHEILGKTMINRRANR